jgi:hypothetical protein
VVKSVPKIVAFILQNRDKLSSNQDLVSNQGNFLQKYSKAKKIVVAI